MLLGLLRSAAHAQQGVGTGHGPVSNTVGQGNAQSRFRTSNLFPAILQRQKWRFFCLVPDRQAPAFAAHAWTLRHGVCRSICGARYR